ncbi:hypothetical protein DNTS_013561 [Danionella cerebrum]|uniref:Uncharacterized protein n=1 Tax=Danionella cerebrum TaxID=2873325 RepID=A0A553Q247_9TELE|nr:hypothetical protein DNTS_013561 [Danionella translucida]
MAGRKPESSVSVQTCPQQKARHEAYRKPTKEAEQEINLMISCQSTAQRAVRLEQFLSVRESKIKPTDCMDQLQRRRVEEILEDEHALTLKRR